MLSARVADSVGEVAQRDWDALLGDPERDEPSPFVTHAFLTSLEEAGTLGHKSGWIPKVVLIERDQELVAAAPAYVKLHSQGEFVFDFAFADLAARMGLEYYPKLLAGVPFTPVTGRRLLTRPGEDRALLMHALGRTLIALAEELGCSSVHVNFAKPEEIAALTEVGFSERHGIQYHWYRDDAEKFDDYLARFNSKKRNQLKREVREMSDQHLAIETVRGAALDDKKLMKLAFELYKSTVDKFYWGRRYLNEDAFRLFAQRCPDAMELVLARTDDGKGRVVAGAINFASGRRLFGRYWGALEEHKFLHFNVCYYRGIEECVERKLDVFEPGAGGEHKLVRGFVPTITRSAHWFRDPRFGTLVRRYLGEEKEAIARDLARESE